MGAEAARQVTLVSDDAARRLQHPVLAAAAPARHRVGCLDLRPRQGAAAAAVGGQCAGAQAWRGAGLLGQWAGAEAGAPGTES